MGMYDDYAWAEVRDDVLQVLWRACELLEDGMCHGCEAVDKAGNPVLVLSDEAVKFSVHGAIMRATSEPNGRQWVDGRLNNAAKDAIRNTGVAGDPVKTSEDAVRGLRAAYDWLAHRGTTTRYQA